MSAFGRHLVLGHGQRGFDDRDGGVAGGENGQGRDDSEDEAACRHPKTQSQHTAAVAFSIGIAAVSLKADSKSAHQLTQNSQAEGSSPWLLLGVISRVCVSGEGCVPHRQS